MALLVNITQVGSGTLISSDKERIEPLDKSISYDVSLFSKRLAIIIHLPSGVNVKSLGCDMSR